MTAADVTYAQVSSRPEGPGRLKRIVSLTFPNGNTAGNNQYPAGGIPLSIPGLGCPKALISLTVLGRTPAGAGLNPVYEWNGSQTAPTLISFETATAAADNPLTEQDTDAAHANNSQVVFVEVRGY